jgi:hypothetical protein
MSTQLRNAGRHHQLQMVRRTRGNSGRAVCLQATVQRPNVINVNGDRPTMSNIRQPEILTRTAGGEHTTEPNTTKENKSPRGDALAGGNQMNTLTT